MIDTTSEVKRVNWEEDKKIIQRINEKIDKCLSILDNLNWNNEVTNDKQLHTKNRRRIPTSH